MDYQLQPTDFDVFWQKYPRKVGKLAAIKEFSKARRSATLEAILEGVETYKRSKPEYADWCHPKTWLSQGRWMDEPESVATTFKKIMSDAQLIFKQKALERVESRIKWIREELPNLHGDSVGEKLKAELRTLKEEQAKIKSELGLMA